MNNSDIKKVNPIKLGTFLWSPRWFLIIRLFGVLSLLCAIFLSQSVFNVIGPNYKALWILSVILLISDILYFAYCRTGYLSQDSTESKLFRRLQIFTIIQINVDLIILTFILHYSGGATNPFILFYFFHVILSSILLSRKTAYMEALWVTFLFNMMTILEGSDIIPHYILFHGDIYTKITFIIGICFAFTSAIFLAVYMATSVVERLRHHEKELESALEEKARLEEEKARFLDIVAHDLKGPLASIETMITSSLAVYGDEIPQKVKNIIERIPPRTQSLLRFIKELLDFSQMQGNKLQNMVFDKVNFNDIVSLSVEMLLNSAKNKNINLVFNPAPNAQNMSGNRTLLEHMVTNLISNAIQYTPENGNVTVSVSPENDEIILTVADTGIGIPEKDIPNVFNDFFRAVNSRKFSSSGSGLGLSITREIAETHNGSISFVTKEGEGTVFTVRLPSYRD